VKDYLDLNALTEISEQQGHVTKELLAEAMDIKLGDAVTNSNGKRLKAEHLKLTHAIFQHAISHNSGKVAIEAERLTSLIENT
jgi:hypothetical protein